MSAAAAPPAFRLSPRLVVGLSIAGAVAMAALLSLVWTPHGAAPMTFAAPLAPPDAAHWLGTDAAGRDVVSALLPATLTTLLFAALATLVSLLLGGTVGAATALRLGAGRTPAAPAIGLVAPALAIGIILTGLGAPPALTIIVGIAGPGSILAGIAARQALAPLWRRDYVASARIAGLGALASAQRHVVPRLSPRLAALALELMAAAIVIEVSLSFAGLGVAAPGTSLGTMLREAQQFGMIRPILVVVPGAVAVVTAFALLVAASGLGEARRGAA